MTENCNLLVSQGSLDPIVIVAQVIFLSIVGIPTIVALPFKLLYLYEVSVELIDSILGEVTLVKIDEV